jgi:hypothetical protein
MEELAGRGGVPAGREQHVDDLSVLVDGPVHVAPHPVDLHVGFVHVPPVTGPVSAEPRRVQQQRGEPLDPPVHRDVINLDTAFEQEFFNVAIGQAEPQVPAHRATTITSGGNRNPGER